MGRAPCCDRASVKRGPWSPDEDDILKSYIHHNGTGGNWIALPHKAGLNRCGKSCRLRWLNYLRPDIKHGGFTEHDDRVIISLYDQIGSKWSVIASKMPGRTDNDIKNYWNTKLKKKYMSQNKVLKIEQNPQTPTVARQPPPAFLAGINQGEPTKEEQKPYNNMHHEQIAQKKCTTDNFTVSASEEVSSAASSSVTVENYNCLNWGSADLHRDDDLFLSDHDHQLDFGANYSDNNCLLNLTNMAEFWANFEVKSEGFFNSLAPLY